MMNLLKQLFDRGSPTCLKHFSILAFSNLLFVFSLSAQGLISDTNVIISKESAIQINGDLTVRAPFLLEGFVNLKGDFVDDYGVISHEGKLIFQGVGGLQYLAGSGHTILHHLEVEADSEIHLTPAKQLTVSGVILNHNPNRGIVLRSDENAMASLIHQTPAVWGHFERFFPYPAGQYHMLSSPVEDQTIEPEFYRPGDLFYAWYEPLYSWVNYENTFDFPTFLDANQNTEAFISAAGYLVAYNNLDEGMNPKIFEGSFHQGEISYVLSRKAHDYDPSPGYNLLGNPFPSAIDWLAEEGWSGKEHLVNGKMGVAWRWHNGRQNFGVIHPVARSKDHNGVSQIIPATEGFFVHAASGSHGEIISMDNRVRIHDQPKSLRSTKTEMQQDVLRLEIACLQHGFLDEVILEYGHQRLMTAEKLLSPNPESPQIYVFKDDNKYSMLLLPDKHNDREYTVRIETPTSGRFSLTISGSDLDSLMEIVNKQTNQRMLLSGAEPFVFDGSDSPFLEITIRSSK